MLATCADDRSILIWFTKDFTAKDHKSVRANVQFDHADRIKWSPDSKAFIIHCATSNHLQVHKVILNSQYSIKRDSHFEERLVSKFTKKSDDVAVFLFHDFLV